MIASTPSAIKDHDVLFGRGKQSALHVGNISFRALIESKFDDYMAGDIRGVARARLFVEVSDSVVQAGGRFLKKAGSRWVEVDMATARCKVAQHFRDGVKLRRKSRQLLRGCEFALDFIKDSKRRSFAEMVQLVSERLPLEKDYSDHQCTGIIGKQAQIVDMPPRSQRRSVKSLLCPDLPKSYHPTSRTLEGTTTGLEPLPLADESFLKGEEDKTEDEFVLRLLARAHELVCESVESDAQVSTTGSSLPAGALVSEQLDSLESWSEITELLNY